MNDAESDPDITRLLSELSAGRRAGADRLLPLVYDELRALARSRMRAEKPGQTLQATALVHEAFLRVAGVEGLAFEGRQHFFATAALAMRRILVEAARRKASDKHGGEHVRVPFEAIELAAVDPGTDVLALEDVLGRLEARDPRKGKIVELRVFCGFTAQETADALGLSLGTIEREWRFLKAWLRTELDGPG